MNAPSTVTIIVACLGVLQAVIIAIFGYAQWRGSQRAAVLESKEETDQHLMVVFQAQLSAALVRIDAQDATISALRDEIHQLKIKLTDQVIENRKLQAELKGGLP